MIDHLDEIFGMRIPSFAKAPKTKSPKRQQRPEDLLHFAVAKLLRYIIGQPGVASRDGVLWFSVEFRNSGRMITTASGKKINLEGVRRKAVGCIAGLPDVAIICRGRFHGIELKTDVGRVSEAQNETHAAIRRAQGLVAVARSPQDVVAALDDWRVPHLITKF